MAPNHEFATVRSIALALLALLPAPAVAADSAWQPVRNVEIVAPAAAGSALDSVARLFQRVVQDQKMIPVSMSVANKAT